MDPNPIDSFFQANYNVTNLADYANRQVSQGSYVLVSWNEFSDVQKRYLDGGYVMLGTSNWVWGFGVPLRGGAIAYASSSIEDQIVQAENTLQRTWDRLPTTKKNALRAQEYAFINRNYSLRQTNPDRWLAMIKERTAWVAAQ